MPNYQQYEREPERERQYAIYNYPGMPRRDLTKPELQLAIHVAEVNTRNRRFPVEFDLDKYIEEYRLQTPMKKEEELRIDLK